ncbi:thiamine pyrophosphate-dependent dehydrogenase E1 component subunit alpha [Seohaeicola zhoushanensis]|uniref:ABC transporter substrate-binding protein n=1 Tax=Seohaeicola zhoushanensis TaxID=1569283 RepID=A0A8J3M6V8_9RHOB|nr:thiamine pyrophosphate-dependent dehydrogenase E1 component subunit alpha [Seohaeicola zhoushanensis]GHF49484.1 ABC transporter substrate-binding protein [Seohaeicola zhoushanensis]
MQLNRDDLKRAYRTMMTIRAFEERVEKEFADGTIPGFAHVYLGQEASGTGICFDLTDEDQIGSTHRGHGHCIAKGCEVEGMFLEIMGKQGGICGGKGGSMHIADMDKGMLGANAIVGGSPPIAVGAALTQKLRRTGRVAVAFSGDGASNQGTTLEAMNMAVVLQVPMIFVFENNGYGEFTSAEYSVGAPSLTDRAAAFGMPAQSVDGGDFFAVQAAMREALEHARAGKGPYALETHCARFLGHFVGDPQKYRGPDELAAARANDPILRFRSKVADAALLETAELDEIDAEVRARIDAAAAAAREAPLPALATLEADVYVKY